MRGSITTVSAVMTKDELLAVKSPEEIFSSDPATADREWKLLRSKWHPDHQVGADAVFSHLFKLYELALEKFKNGTWHTPGKLVVTTLHGVKQEIKYRRKHSFELGDLYVGDYYLTYVISNANLDLVNSAKSTWKKFKFDTPEMRKEFERCLPNIKTSYELKDHQVIVLNKSPELLCLRDILALGPLDPRHVAWILSSMYNIACYLEHVGLGHHAIDLDGYFVNPKTHEAGLLGGWWYSTSLESRLVALPPRTLQWGPSSLKSVKKSTRSIDGELIRACGRELLGDVGGSKLLTNPTIPNALLNWLQLPSTKSARDEYKEWQTVLTNSFGPRKFVELKISSDDLYGKAK